MRSALRVLSGRWMASGRCSFVELVLRQHLDELGTAPQEVDDGGGGGSHGGLDRAGNSRLVPRAAAAYVKAR
jgi:hypothetical protein